MGDEGLLDNGIHAQLVAPAPAGRFFAALALATALALVIAVGERMFFVSESIDDLFVGRDLPPRAGPELAAMRLESLERRVAALERQLLQFTIEGQHGDKLLPHQLASVDRLLEGGLISWDHAAQRKRELIEQAGYEAIDVTTMGASVPDFIYVMPSVE